MVVLRMSKVSLREADAADAVFVKQNQSVTKANTYRIMCSNYGCKDNGLCPMLGDAYR